MAAAANATTASIPEMGLALQQSAAPAHQLGIPIQDLVTMLGELANRGIKGSDAGTSVKTMLQALIPNSKQAAEKMKSLGVEVFDTQGKFKGMPSVIGQYHKALADLNQEQQASALKTIFGSDAVRAASIIFGSSAKSFDQLKGKMTEQGAAADLAKSQTEGYNGAVEAMKSAFDTAQIAIGDVFLPVLTKGSREAAKFVSELGQSGKLTEWSHDLLSGGKTAIQVLEDVAGAAADAGHVGVEAAQGILAVARALDIDAPTGIEAALAAMAGFKVAGIVAPMVATLATNIRLLATAPTAGALAGDLAAMVNPYTVAAIAVGGLAAGLVLLGSQESAEAKAADASAAAHKRQAEAVKDVMAAERAAADKGFGAQQATIDLDKAKEARHEAATGKGGKKSDAYRQAVLNEREAILRNTAAHKDYEKQLRTEDTANETSLKRAKERVTATDQEVKATKDAAFVQSRTGNANDQVAANEKVAAAQGKAKDAVEAYINAIARSNISDRSRQRLMAGSDQISEKNAVGIAHLAAAMQSIPERKQAQILLKGDQEALSRVGNLIAGVDDVPTTKAINAVLKGSEAVRTKLAAITALTKGVPAKTVTNVLANSDSAKADVLAFRAILAGVPTSKVTTVLGNTKGKAEIAALKALIDNINSKSVSVDVTTRYKQIGVPAPNSAGGGGPARRATGRAAGKGETALVGEGRHDREAVVDPASGLAFMVDRPTVLNLPDSAYVIPEDPNMRGGAMGLLAMLAGDLGLQGFAKGKQPAVRATSTGRSASSPGKKQLPVPDKITYAAVDEQSKKDEVTDARDAYKKRRDSVAKYEKKIDADEAALKKAKKHKGKGAATAVKDANDKLSGDRAQLNALRNGSKKLPHSLSDLRSLWQEQSRELRILQGVNREIERLNTIQETDRQKMSNAAGRHDEKAYNAAQQDRRKVLGDLKKRYEKAISLAKAGSKLKADLESSLAGVDGDIQDSDQTYADAQPQSDADKAAQDAADRYADTGMTDAERARLSEINKNIALAALTDTLDDDKASAGDLVTFLSNELAAAPGRGMSNDVIADLASQVKQARDNVTSLMTGGTSNSNPDLQAQLDQANERVRIADENARINRQALATFAGSGDIGAGGPSAAQAARGGNVVYQTINTLHPGTPAVAQALAAAAAGGVGYQGGRPSKVERVG